MRGFSLTACALVVWFLSPTSSAQLLPLGLPEQLQLETGARSPALASNPAGETLVVYAATEGPEAGKLHGVLLERFSNQGGASQVLSADPITFSPSVAALPGGGWLVVWSTEQNSVPRVHTRRLDAAGEPVAAATVLATLAPDELGWDPGAAAVGCAPGAGCVVAWQSERPPSRRNGSTAPVRRWARCFSSGPSTRRRSTTTWSVA